MANKFAAAVKAYGAEMHRVVHSITVKELTVFDKIEVLYIRKLVETCLTLEMKNKHLAKRMFMFLILKKLFKILVTS